MSNSTKEIKAKDLKIGMHLCYRAAELLTASPTATFLRNDELVGEITGFAYSSDSILVRLGYSRSVLVGKREMRLIEVSEPAIAQAHLGTATRFRGVSIE